MVMPDGSGGLTINKKQEKTLRKISPLMQRLNFNKLVISKNHIPHLF